MEEELEIILQAIDNASDTFASVGQSANEMGNTLEQSFEEANAEVERLREELDMAFMMGEDWDVLEQMEQELADAEAEAERLGEALNIDSGPMEDAASAADDLETEVEEAADAMDRLGSAGDVMAAETLMQVSEGVANGMMDMANAAGTFEDSVNRASLEAEGFGISADAMTDTISELSETTGRAGGQIRESFIKATARGVTDLDSFKTMMEGAGAQAYLFGTDIQTMADKFSTMALRSSVAERQLGNTGITVEELGEAMGMQGATLDEINAKWATMDANQRAAALGMAASMNEGKDANDAYKHSWEGLQDQIDIAIGRIQRIAGSVLLPVLVPAMELAGQVLQGFGDVLSWVMSTPLGGFISVLGTAAGLFVILTTGISALSTVLGFLGLETTFTTIETIALAIAEEGLSVASISAAVSSMGLSGGLLATATAGWAAATAIWAALAPLLPFIAIGAAVVLIIYEIGKAFGWWTDVGSMLDAISSGIQRLWSAFVNHPDVQAAIQAITGALQWLWGAIQNAGAALMDFLGIGNGGEFDIVRAIIDGLSVAWEGMTLPIRTLIGLVQLLMPYLQSLYDNVLVPLGEFLVGVFTPVWQLLVNVFNAIMPYIMNLSNAFTQFANGQMSLPGLIMTVMTSIWNIYSTVFSMISQAVLSWGRQMLNRGLNAARGFVNAVVNFIRQLPGKIYSLLLQVVSRIVSAGQQWVSNAKSKAQEIVSGVSNVLSGTANAVASALSGVVDAIVKPFRDAYNQAKQWWDQITSLGGAAGGDAYGGDLPEAMGGDIEVSTNDTVTLEHNLNISLDLANVPSHISTEQLVGALTDRNVLRELTSNRDFQLLDSQAKERLNLKINRARGV